MRLQKCLQIQDTHHENDHANISTWWWHTSYQHTGCYTGAEHEAGSDDYLHVGLGWTLSVTAALCVVAGSCEFIGVLTSLAATCKANNKIIQRVLYCAAI